ncbi:transcription factor bHLH110-like isoform X2 [Jatropha curcas]|uniref:transcription factor bHLH110-like isoform X2 n=1 Tax=Jatropha curcas TaxID=180498 RepID=UPI0009D6DCF2|nr:transcription factor bHLH110-like isoform X2 [Jatropha curcas]
MEPANLHPQHQLQEQYGGFYSSLLFQPDYNKVSSTNNIILECWQPNSKASMCEGLMSLYETTDTLTQQSATNEFLLSKIKEEMPINSFPKLNEMVPTKHPRHHLCQNDNWLMSNFSSAPHITELQLLATAELYSNDNIQNSTRESSSFGSNGRYNSFSPIIPKINVSNSDLDLNLQVLDLLNTKPDGSSSSFGHSMGEVKDNPSSSSNKSVFVDTTQRKKRPCSFIEASKNQPPSKSSCPPLLKVGKNKIREKIATLQRLVAPYGKTDTASVLTEAIGYIQFLHDQVETLSVPYMRSANSKRIRTIKASSREEDENGEPKRDLLSRGLCLIPLSCASIIFNSYNGGI